MISHAEGALPSGLAGCVHAKVTESYTTVPNGMFNKIGFWQLGAGAHVTSATHPGEAIVPLELKTKVKQPSGDDEVIGAGIVVPE